MQIYCIKNEFITPAVQYTLDFLLNRSGFFYRWLASGSEIINSGIILSYGKKMPPSNTPHLYLPRFYDPLNLSQHNAEWKEFLTDDTSLPVLKLSYDSHDDVPFDLIATVFFFLSRMEEKKYRHPDDADKFYKESLLYQYGQFYLPLVDMLADWFSRRITELFRKHNLPYLRKSDFPDGKRMGLALTHDVDITRAYNPLQRTIFKWKSAEQKKAVLQAEEDIWAFDRLLPFYKEKGWRATFNFIARLRENTHYRYNIKSSRFRTLINRLQEEGHEIGLHPSRYAFEHPQRYVKEKKRLEEVAGQAIWGMRQHYLRALYPALWQTVEDIGLKYDATLAFRRQAGFRGGVCAPFNCFDYRVNKALSCMEFPTAFFESSLPGNGQDEETAIKAIRHFFEITQKYRGLLTILWHPSNMYTSSLLNRLWREITEQAVRFQPYIAPFKQHYNWQIARRQLHIDSVQWNVNTIRIIIKNHSAVHNIDIGIYGIDGDVRASAGKIIPIEEGKSNSYRIEYEGNVLKLEFDYKQAKPGRDDEQGKK